MLRLLHPVVAQQALELRVEVLVVADALDVVPLRHPLDLQDHERHGERVVRQHRARDRRAAARSRRSGVPKPRCELLAEALEEVDVLRLLAREREQRADAVVVAVELRPRVVEHERQDELLHEAEHVQVAVAADLVEGQLLLAASGTRAARPAPATRAGTAGEVEPLVAADQVLDPPVDLSEAARTAW